MKTYLILIPNHGVCNGIANEKSPYRAFLIKTAYHRFGDPITGDNRILPSLQ